MIRNIEDEKNKLIQRFDSDFSAYFSEEELNELIEQVETREMLRAPVHLKSNIIGQIRQEKRSAQKRQMFAYRAKVLVAMAAALTLLILMPDDRTESGGGIFIEQPAQEEVLEQMALRRQEEMDANWERYLAGRERGGVRGFLKSINEKITEFADLYDSANDGEGKTDIENVTE